MVQFCDKLPQNITQMQGPMTNVNERLYYIDGQEITISPIIISLISEADWVRGNCNFEKS